MAEEGKNSLDIDNWLDDFQEEESQESEELNQTDIDSLLGNGEKQEAAADDAASEDAGELDQSDIDALLSGDDASGQEFSAHDEDDAQSLDNAALGEEGDADLDASVPPDDELDQSDIDALLGGGQAAGGDQPQPEAAAGDFAELDQANIDELLGDNTAGQPESSESEDLSEPSKEEMDQLFAGIDQESGGDEGFEAEPASFSEVMAGNGAGEDTFSLEGDDNGFGSADFDFDEENIPDIPDETGAVNHKGDDTVAEDIFTESDSDETVGMPEFYDEDQEGAEDSARGRKYRFPLPGFLNKTVMSITAASLLIVIGVFWFLFREKKEPPAISLNEIRGQQVVSETTVAEPPAEALPNTAPMVANAELAMKETGGEVPVLLSGKDADSDALQFKITKKPEHGRLSGELPNLIYLPNKDFPGEDQFEYIASDGKDVSIPATVVIKGPQLGKQEVKQAKTIQPKRPIVSAKNVTLKMLSTEDLIVDWQDIWEQANFTPFTDKVKVEVVAKDLHGELTQISPSEHHYRPDKFFGGYEIIDYRFRLDGVSSKMRQLMIQVKLGDPAPEIHIKPLAEVYEVGDTVIIDAGPSKDDARGSLMFHWKQIDGVPVQMVLLNDEGSAVSFVVPSSFHSGGEYPGPVIQIIATDQTGQIGTKEVAIAAKPRYQAALWRGSKNGEIQPVPRCPQGKCPGDLLPWPYPD